MKEFREKERRDRDYLDLMIKRGRTSLLTDEVPMKDWELEEYSSLASMLLSRKKAFLTKRNSVTIFNDGKEKFKALFEALREAKHHIHAEYYIIRNDKLGNEFLEILMEKSKQGVQVRLLVDAIGTNLPAETTQKLKEAGVKVAVYNPSLIPHIALLNRTVNFRNHRKIVVIDGWVGFLGGFNVGDEYLGEDEKLGNWRDTHLEIDGRAVLALQLRFILDWNYASKEDLEITPEYFPTHLLLPQGATVQIVSGGPDNKWDLVQQSYLKMVTTAKQSIYIQTPYFVPDESIRDALRIAALSGVDIKIMVPKKPDHPFVHWANLSYLGELLDSGVKAYEYTKGFLHAKTIVIDGAVTSIGSANWDIRSFELNFETNAVIYNRDVAVVQQESFEKDLEDCVELTKEEYDKRSSWVKVKEAVSRLFSNVL